jgi:hypothetical protein
MNIRLYFIDRLFVDIVIVLLCYDVNIVDVIILVYLIAYPIVVNYPHLSCTCLSGKLANKLIQQVLSNQLITIIIFI